jgi:hypothetical protein
MVDSVIFSVSDVSKFSITKDLMRILISGVQPHKRKYSSFESKIDLVNKKSVFNKKEYNFYSSVINLPSSGTKINCNDFKVNKTIDLFHIKTT